MVRMASGRVSRVGISSSRGHSTSQVSCPLPWGRGHANKDCVWLRGEGGWGHRNSSVQCSRLVVSDSLWPHGLQHTLPVHHQLKFMSIESVMPSNHFILYCPLPLPSSNFSSIRVFSNEWVLHIRWSKYRSFSFSISPSNEYSGLISFRMNCLNLLPCSPRGSQESSPTPQFKSINSLVLSFL